MVSSEQMSGVLSSPHSLRAGLHSNHIVSHSGSLQETAADWYDGPYDVTPTTNIQMLFTEDKTMSDNVIVLAIPYSEVSNTSGGYTAVIG